MSYQITRGRLRQYVPLAGPVLVPQPAATNGGGPAPRTGTVPIIQYQAFAGPVVVPSQVVSPVTGASPVFVAKVYPRRRQHASQHQAFFFDRFDAPDEVTPPELTPLSNADFPRRRSTRAAYMWAEPMFGVPVAVPVMSWTGHFPDRLSAWQRPRRVSQFQWLGWDTVLFPDVVVAPDQAVPVYPDRVHARRRVAHLPEPRWPVFTADATVVAPEHAWDPTYPDQLWPRRALAARYQETFAYGTLEPVPVIAVSHLSGGRGYYIVPGRARSFPVPPHKRKFTVH